MDGISIRRTGIAKVLWRKLDVEVPKSEVIANGVNIYKGETGWEQSQGNLKRRLTAL